MPRMENNGGDVLARGAARATFMQGKNTKVTREAWDDMFADFDPEKFKNAAPPSDPNSIKADSAGGFAETESVTEPTE